MIRYEEFDQHVDAHIAYAFDLASADALEILERRFLDGSWTRAAVAWVNALAVLSDRATDRDAVHRLIESVTNALIERPLDDATHQILANLVGWGAGLDVTQLERVADWMVRNAAVGDSSLFADVISRVSHDRDRIPALYPVVAWLIDNGASELRSRHRGSLVRELVVLVHEKGDVERLLPAVRYMLAWEGPFQVLRNAGPYAGIDGFLDALEQLLGTGVIGISIVADVARRIPDPRHLFRQSVKPGGHFADHSWIDRPALRSAIVMALLAGMLTTEVAVDVWSHVLAVQPPDPVVFATSEALDNAVRALEDDGFRRPGEWWPEVEVAAYVRQWASEITYARLRQSCGADGCDADTIERLCRLLRRRDALNDGVEDAVARFVAESEPHRFSLARRILQEPAVAEVRSRGRVRSILRALVEPVPAPRADGRSTNFESLQSICARALPAMREGGFVVSAMLDGIERIELSKLKGDDKVRLDGDTLVVNTAEMHDLMRAPFAEEVRLLLGTMYVVHELVHLVQGIGDKAVVGQLRATGAESTLMQLDLAADHLSAVIVEAALGTPLVDLKDMQGRSLVSFAVGIRNNTASRARKANRLVGARLDFLLREQGRLTFARDEHVFADFGPAGPWLAVLGSGPPVRLLGIAPLAKAQAERLSSAADPTTRLEDVDAILAGCISRMTR